MTTTDQHPTDLLWQVGARVSVAYSTKRDGDQRDPKNQQHWLRKLGISACVIPKQVHGTLVVDAHDIDQREKADGIVSDDPHLALGAYGADCPGLVVSAGKVIGIAHCGWRGVAAGIVENLLREISQRTTVPTHQWQALIGPGISQDRYEVDQPVLSARTWPSAAIKPARSQHAYLDLGHSIATDLSQYGVEQITHTQICTADDDRLWSYRHQGSGIVQALVAWHKN